MLHQTMSNSTSVSEEASVNSSGVRIQDFCSMNPMFSAISDQQEPKIKRKRNLPGNPDPDAEVIALSPKTLMATNRFVCEICNKGFQRDQNLQLHRRGHNLPWKLRQRNGKELRKRVYVCPEPSCIHHHPSRALGDLTGIKKHFCRKHGEKKWKCEKCSKRYAVYSDWKAHSKTCGTREYRCDCGTLFSRKDSFVTHRAFCDALAEESARLSTAASTVTGPSPPLQLPPINPSPLFPGHHTPAPAAANLPLSLLWLPTAPPSNSAGIPMDSTKITDHSQISSLLHATAPQNQAETLMKPPPYHHAHLTNPTSSSHQMLSAAAAAAAEVQGSHMEAVDDMIMWPAAYRSSRGGLFEPAAENQLLPSTAWQKRDHQMTRDFLGLAADGHDQASVHPVNVRDLLSFTNHLDFAYDRDNTLTWRDF